MGNTLIAYSPPGMVLRQLSETSACPLACGGSFSMGMNSEGDFIWQVVAGWSPNLELPLDVSGGTTYSWIFK